MVSEKVPTEAAETVTDPNCGRTLNKRDVRNMVFRRDATFYFCSKRCQEQFIRGGVKKKAA